MDSNHSTHGYSGGQQGSSRQDPEALTTISRWSNFSNDSGGLLSQKLPQHGYRSLATRMGSYKSDITLFRRFGDLNMLNLLSLQAELLNLQFDLDAACRSDDELNETWIASKKYAFSFKDMQAGVPAEVEEKDPQAGGNENGCRCCKAKKMLRPTMVELEDGTLEPNFRSKQWKLISQIRQKLKEYSALNKYLPLCVIG
jgi:hypothetical protein